MNATAAASTPICSRPNQPWIRAGVTTRPTPIEKISVRSGVIVSPTPRSIEVTSRKMKKPGMPMSTTRP